MEKLTQKWHDIVPDWLPDGTNGVYRRSYKERPRIPSSAISSPWFPPSPTPPPISHVHRTKKKTMLPSFPLPLLLPLTLPPPPLAAPTPAPASLAPAATV